MKVHHRPKCDVLTYATMLEKIVALPAFTCVDSEISLQHSKDMILC